jgi:hypothetical protein
MRRRFFSFAQRFSQRLASTLSSTTKAKYFSPSSAVRFAPPAVALTLFATINSIPTSASTPSVPKDVKSSTPATEEDEYEEIEVEVDEVPEAKYVLLRFCD